jgi:hypothetical protein
MRNLIWAGAAVALVIVAGFLVAVRHAARHPDSLLMRCSLAVYHLCDDLLAPRRTVKDVEEIAQARPARPVAEAQPAPAGEVIEPIVIEPTDQEPPLAIPRLSPEIAAAIERLRSDEESETPPLGIDVPARALRMPYADEDVEVLPVPARDEPEDPAVSDAWQSELGQFLLLAPSCWRTVVDKLMEALGHERD